MNAQIKERITQINSGKIPDGYKKTESGVIPDNWVICKLSGISKIYDGTHETPNYINEGVRFVSVENIKDISSSDKFISLLKVFCKSIQSFILVFSWIYNELEQTIKHSK